MTSIILKPSVIGIYNVFLRGISRFLLCFVFFFFLQIQLAFAATLSLDPSAGSVALGDTFVLTIRLDTEPDECVNAVGVELRYPQDILKASVVSKGESLLSLWPEEPVMDFKEGVIKFEGGIPAGYCGRIQGDPGKTNVIAKLIFAVPTTVSVDTARPIEFVFGPNTKVLLNDGLGTPAPLTLRGGILHFGASGKEKKNEWLTMVNEDKFPPELFSISLEHDPRTFQGKYFIVFSSVDKQTGIEHYEILEDDPDKIGSIRGKKEKALFVTGTSPYVLTDQSLESRITVRAYDHAGNTQESILAPRNAAMIKPSSLGKNGEYFLFLLGSLALLIAGGVAIWLLMRRRKINNDANDSHLLQ